MPNRIPSKVVIVVTVFVFLAVGVYLWRNVLAPVTTKGLVGVATADGATYFGTLVLADEKSVILRDVYTAGGYYSPPVEEGRPPSKPKFQVNKQDGVGGPGAIDGGEGTVVLSRSRVLFISRDISSVAVEAIRSWTPPTPPPSPPPTPTLGPRETETPVPTVVPTPTPAPARAPTR